MSAISCHINASLVSLISTDRQSIEISIEAATDRQYVEISNELVCLTSYKLREISTDRQSVEISIEAVMDSNACNSLEEIFICRRTETPRWVATWH